MILQYKRIAILSAGLEHRRDRGYENSSRSLFNNLSHNNVKFEVHLYKGSGATAPKEYILRKLFGLKFLKWLGNKTFNDSYVFEYIQFAVAFIILVNFKRTKFDIIYTQEPRVSKTLYQLKSLLPGNPVIVFGMGVDMTPEHYINMSDRVHLINIEHYNAALRAYPDTTKLHLIPNPATEDKLYQGGLSKKELRAKYNIKTQKVLLSVGAINAGIKRMDYVVREAAMLDSSWSLVICGKVHDTNIIALGKKLLGDRFVNIFLPPEEVSQAYALADLFVLSSLIEGFGNVTIEAMQNSLPVLLHKRELNKWIVQDDELLVEMTSNGALSGRINKMVTEEWLLQKGLMLKSLYNSRFSWDSVRLDYYKLFK